MVGFFGVFCLFVCLFTCEDNESDKWEAYFFLIKRSYNASFHPTGLTKLETCCRLYPFKTEGFCCLQYWLWNYVYEHILKMGIKLSFSEAE